MLKQNHVGGEGNRSRGQTMESPECQGEEFELYHHSYLTAPGGNVPGTSLSKFTQVMYSPHFLGAWNSRQRMGLWTDT